MDIPTKEEALIEMVKDIKRLWNFGQGFIKNLFKIMKNERGQKL